MKICFISNLYPPYVIGGAEIVVENEAKSLAKLGHDIIVITTSPYKKSYIEYRDRIKIYRFHPMNIYTTYNHQNQSFFLKPLWHVIDIWNLHTYTTIRKILKNKKPDIVHVHNFKGLSVSVFDAIKDSDIPTVFTAHDYSIACPKAHLIHNSGNVCDDPGLSCRIYEKINKKIIDGKVDLVTAPSNFVLKKLKTFGFFNETETIKIPLGINSKPKKTPKDYDIIDITYIGQLTKTKGVQILIEAFRRIKDQKVQLHIIGKGNDIEKFKTISGSDKRIIFHGFLEGKELEKFYQISNIVVVPSIWYDNSPMVIYESLINSSPVVGSRIGGIPELIEDGVNGCIFESGNVSELEKILKYLINNPSRLKELEKGAFKSSFKYDIEKHINKLFAIYQSLISK